MSTWNRLDLIVSGSNPSLLSRNFFRSWGWGWGWGWRWGWGWGWGWSWGWDGVRVGVRVGVGGLGSTWSRYSKTRVSFFSVWITSCSLPEEEAGGAVR